MNEILVRLYVPTIDEEYDIWIPTNKRIHTIITLLVKALNELSKGYYTPEEMPYLFDKMTSKPYDVNLKVIDSNIKNGSELILI